MNEKNNSDLTIHGAARAYFGADYASLSQRVLDALKARHQTVVVAESCTGGGIGAALTAVPGSSAAFLGGVIAYSNALKVGLLDVPSTILEEYGAVSGPVVEAMAEGAMRGLNADWSIAVSGVAGPGGGSLEKPVGTVHFAVSGPKDTRAEAFSFDSHLSRDTIQRLSVYAGLSLLLKCLRNTPV